jgi:hypothetical protein
MDWSNEPATWKQLKYLREHGFTPPRPLNKAEALELIRGFGGTAVEIAAPVANQLRETTVNCNAYQLRSDVEKAKKRLQAAMASEFESAQVRLNSAISKRQEFWMDTCREARHVHLASLQVHELYQKHGCRFELPKNKDVQYILDALDSAVPNWDRDHPELFYQTLELNFPSLVRMR